VKNQYILGCGLSALIYKFYNPEYKIIGEQIGGMLKNDFMKNTILLHDTFENQQLLKDLGMEIKKKTHLIKYVKNNTIQNKITLIDKIAFIRKKLDDDNIQVNDVTLSTEDYFIPILDVDFTELLDKLKKDVDIIQENIIRISDTEIITETGRYDYDEIVSTLPANIFWDIYYKKQNIQLKSLPITIILTDEVPSVLNAEQFDLAYFCDTRFKYTRINKRGDNYLYEFSGELSEDEVKSHIPKQSIIKEYFVNKTGIIFTDKNNVPPPNIKFLGRFAIWDHSYKIQDAVKASQPNYDFQHIWNRQKSFSKNFIDFDKLNDEEYVTRQTHDYLLHLYSELTEVLECTNYKKHKANKKIDVEKIKIELVDSFKYLLNLFLLYKVDVQEFIKLFNDKSKIVEERWKNEQNK